MDSAHGPQIEIIDEPQDKPQAQKEKVEDAEEKLKKEIVKKLKKGEEEKQGDEGKV